MSFTRFFVSGSLIFCASLSPLRLPRRNQPMKLTRNIGMLLLAVWLILTGLIPLLNFSFQGLGTVMAVLAIASGILIIVGR
jgi:hypothetical protein